MRAQLIYIFFLLIISAYLYETATHSHAPAKETPNNMAPPFLENPIFDVSALVVLGTAAVATALMASHRVYLKRRVAAAGVASAGDAMKMEVNSLFIA